MRLEDETGGVKCVLWPSVYAKHQKLVVADQVLLVSGKMEMSEEGATTLIADGVERLDEAMQRRARAIVVQLPERSDIEQTLDRVFKVLNHHKGDCEVFVEMRLTPDVLVRARPHGALRIGGSLELEASLREAGCRVEWLGGDAHRRAGDFFKVAI